MSKSNRTQWFRGQFCIEAWQCGNFVREKKRKVNKKVMKIRENCNDNAVPFTKVLLRHLTTCHAPLVKSLKWDSAVPLV